MTTTATTAPATAADFTDQYYQDTSAALHWLSAQDQANLTNQGRPVPPTGWTAITGAQAQALLNPAPTVAQAQAAQTAILSAACAAAITAGFTASALGTPNTYTLSATDQTNLISAYTAAQQASSSAKPWVAGATVAQYAVAEVNGAYYLALTAGATGAAAPAWPTAFQQEVTDGTVTWAIAGWLLGTSAGNRWHTPSQVVAAYNAYLAWVNGQRAKYTALAAQISAAATVAAVQAVTW